MEEENIKKCWENAKRKLDGSETPNFDANRLTALEQLARRYKRFSNLGLIFMLLTPLQLVQVATRVGNRVPIWFLIATMAFFGLASLMDLWLYNGIKGIDLAKITVEETLRRCLFYRKRHLQFVMLLVPLAAAIITYIVYLMHGDSGFEWGAAVGVVVGLVMGLRALMAFLSDYRSAIS